MAVPIFYIPRPMDKAKVTSVTSEATNHPVEKAMDNQLDTYWAPTSTSSQVIVIDLDNDMHERITLVLDRDFNTASGTNWTNNDMTGFAITAGDLNLAATGTGQYCYLAAAGFQQFYSGHTYRITYDYTETVAGFKLQTGAAQDIGACVAGAGQELTFTASADSTTMRIVSTSSSAEGEFDNFSIVEVAPAADSNVDAVALWIQNANTHQGAATCVIEYSDDNSNWTGIDNPVIMTEMNGTLGDPLRIYEFSGSEAHRYWRISFASLAYVINVGQIWLLEAFAPGIPDKYDRTISHAFGDFRRIPLRTFGRTYTAFSSAVQTVFLDMFDACRGSELPIVLKEDSAFAVVQMVYDSLTMTERDYQVWDFAFDLQTLPYVADGESL